MIEIRFARFSFSTNLDCCNFSDYLDQFTLYLLDFCPRVYEGELLIFALLRDNKFLTSLISPGSQIKRTPKCTKGVPDVDSTSCRCRQKRRCPSVAHLRSTATVKWLRVFAEMLTRDRQLRKSEEPIKPEILAHQCTRFRTTNVSPSSSGTACIAAKIAWREHGKYIHICCRNRCPFKSFKSD